MGSSGSVILTKLQAEFLEAFFPVQPDFFLTGGTALAAYYLEHRLSQDLDLFTLSDEAMGQIGQAVHSVGNSIGAEVESVQTTPYFRRFLLRRKQETALVDCVREYAEQIVADKPQRGVVRIDALEDIHCNKICTLLGRAEIKDYIDVYFLSQAGFFVPPFLVQAQRKDGGLSPAILSHLISQARFASIPSYVLKPVTVSELEVFFRDLSAELARISFPAGRSPEGRSPGA